VHVHHRCQLGHGGGRSQPRRYKAGGACRLNGWTHRYRYLSAQAATSAGRKIGNRTRNRRKRNIGSLRQCGVESLSVLYSRRVGYCRTASDSHIPGACTVAEIATRQPRMWCNGRQMCSIPCTPVSRSPRPDPMYFSQRAATRIPEQGPHLRCSTCHRSLCTAASSIPGATARGPPTHRTSAKCTPSNRPEPPRPVQEIGQHRLRGV